jgi:PAS domain S-box-containing protein
MSERLRVLIVEDNQGDVDLIREALPDVGHVSFQIEAVSRLSEALAWIDSSGTDLVLLDLGLPDSQGLGTFHKLRKVSSEIPVIILTGNDDQEVAVAAVREGAQDFLFKGQLVGSSQITRAVRYAVERKKTEKALAQVAREWQNTFDATNNAIWILDQDQRVLRSNKIAERFFHRPLGEMIGKYCWEIVHGTDQPIPECPFLRARKSLRRETKELQESEHWLEVSVDPILDAAGRYSGAVHIVSDITGRKQAEEELRASEARYRRLFEHMAEGFAYCRMIFENGEPQDFIYLAVNTAFETLTGLRNVTGKKVSEVIPGIREADPQLLAIYARVSLTGKPEKFEMFVEALKMWFSMSVYGPEKEHFVAVFDVITTRKLAEEELRKSEKEFHLLAESMPQIVWVTRKDGWNIYFNQQWMDYTGLTMEESYGHGWNIPFHPDDQQRAWGAWQKATKNNDIYSLECQLRRADGVYRWWLIRGVPLLDENGEIIKWFGTCTDIDDLKQVEEALKREQALNNVIIDSIPGAFYMLDENGRYVRWNAYQRDEIVGKPQDLIAGTNAADTIHPDDRALIISKMANVLESGTEETVEGRILLRGGPTFRWLLMTGRRMTIDGRPFLVGIGIDITERKRAYEQKVKLEGQLLQTHKMEAIGTLAGGIAHDFNNILAAMIGYTELSLTEDQKGIQHQYLQETLKGAERAKDLVKQILTFSRQDSREKKPLDIKLLLKEAIKFLRASMPATIEFRQQFTSESCNILADHTQMYQVIMNLCTNASHSMRQTGGVLMMELSTMELAKDEILHHTGLKPGPYVKITVSDTGHGIDPAFIQRIFDPFFTTKSKDEGTGLGLSVVYGIVKSHDGVINVYSEPGKGASFSVYLPRIIHEAVTIESIPETVIGGTEQILFVDDEPALVDIGRLILSSLGYKVTGVTSSNEALDLFRANPERFDLVITDMTLPKMTGIDLSREILQIRQDIPVILCSGLRDPETEEQVMSLGIRAYCTKPLTRKDLSRVIRDTLDGHERPLCRE